MSHDNDIVYVFVIKVIIVVCFVLVALSTCFNYWWGEDLPTPEITQQESKSVPIYEDHFKSDANDKFKTE